MRDQNENDEMDDLIRRSTQVEIPAEVEERLRHRLAAFRTRVEERPPSRWRSPVSRPAFRIVAMAATAAAAVAVGLVVMPREASASRVYAAAAEQLRTSQSIEYTIVLNETPYVGIDFSYAAPGYRRANCSWGIEARVDRAAQKQIVLMHLTRMYVVGSGKQAESPANSEDLVESLLSLPPAAGQVLGEQRAGGKRLIGYRVPEAQTGASFTNMKTFDLWVDAGTRQADHVDIAIQEPDKPVHHMYIRNIRVNGQVDRSLFDLTPPTGYSAITAQDASKPAPNPGALVLRAEIRQAPALTAVVLPMTGSYAQAPAALPRVGAYLKAQGVTPTGQPFGRFGSEQSWDVGYPVPQGTTAEAPLQVVSVAAAQVASATVTGPWGADSITRWSAFIRSVIEQGYAPAGPPMEIWSGGGADAKPPSTEMRMAVTKAQ